MNIKVAVHGSIDDIVKTMPPETLKKVAPDGDIKSAVTHMFLVTMDEGFKEKNPAKIATGLMRIILLSAINNNVPCNSESTVLLLESIEELAGFIVAAKNGRLGIVVTPTGIQHCTVTDEDLAGAIKGSKGEDFAGAIKDSKGDVMDLVDGLTKAMVSSKVEIPTASDATPKDAIKELGKRIRIMGAN